MTRMIWAAVLVLIVGMVAVAVLMSGAMAPVCMAGSPAPCKDTEHPGEPPCNMKTCKRGKGNNCSHWCSKGAGCCFCGKQCNTGTPAPQPDERPE